VYICIYLQAIYKNHIIVIEIYIYEPDGESVVVVGEVVTVVGALVVKPR